MSDYEQHLLPSFTGRLWLLLALLLVALPHLLRLPLWMTAFGLAIFGWRLLHELRGYDLPTRPLRILLTLGGIAAIGLQFHSLVGRDAGVALLTLMLCLKLVELRTLRDAMVTLYLAYFLMITGFLFDQGIFTGLYLMLVVLILTAALLALNHPAASPANTRRYLRHAGALLLQSLPLMIVMFLLFPRLSGPLWNMPDDKPSARTGLSDELSMGSFSDLVDSDEVAFRVNFEGPLPAANQLYWRGPVLWQTDGRRWQRIRQPVYDTLPRYRAEGDRVSYAITLEASDKHWLFALDLPTTLPQGLTRGAEVLADFQLLNPTPVTTQLRYRIDSALRYRNTALPDWAWEQALQLPEHANPRSVALAQQWRRAASNDREVIEQARRYLSDNPFHYTRQPPLLRQTDPVDQFLFDSREGFCEHYASAFVTLMRAADIPARIVLGYQGGERNNLGNYLIVRQSNAHAWAEVWLEDLGWSRVDPTSWIPEERVRAEGDAQRFSTTDLLPLGSTGPGNALLGKAYWKLRHTWDAINHNWNQWVLGFDREQQKKLLQKLGMGEFGWERLILLLVASLFSLLLVVAAVVLLRRPRQRDPVQRLYQQLCRKLAKLGSTKKAHEGPEDFARRACAEQPQLGEKIRRASDLYIKLRYQRDASQGLVKELAEVVRGM